MDFDPDEFSRLVGVKPTKVWRAWASGVKNNTSFEQIVWRYDLKRRLHWSIDDAIREMLDHFNGQRVEIISFAKQHICSLQLRCRLHGDETVIVYQIEQLTIKQFAAFGCSFSLTIDPRAYGKGQR